MVPMNVPHPEHDDRILLLNRTYPGWGGCCPGHTQRLKNIPFNILWPRFTRNSTNDFTSQGKREV